MTNHFLRIRTPSALLSLSLSHAFGGSQFLRKKELLGLGRNQSVFFVGPSPSGSERATPEIIDLPLILCRVAIILGVDSPFCSTIILSKNRSLFPQGLGWFFGKRRMPGFRMEQDGLICLQRSSRFPGTEVISILLIARGWDWSDHPPKQTTRSRDRCQPQAFLFWLGSPTKRD